MNEIDIKKIKEALSILKQDGELFEIRILQGKRTLSGYFKSVDVLEQAFKTVDLRNANIFYTLNQISEDCYSREQKDCFRLAKETTSDKDIEGYQWMLVDLDPVRKTGISSTNEEVKKAYEVGKRIIEYLRERKFAAPIMALSGNGIHLLYRIGLKNTPANVQLVERCLKALSFMFSDEYVEVDQKVFNPARISKLYGTVAHKGANTKERPHRMSRIISNPAQFMNVKKEQLELLAAEYPEEPKTTHDRRSESFDIEKWIHEHGIEVANVRSWKDTTKYVLKECPFDSNHKAPDATIIKQPSGAIAFKCFHNSCSGHDWHELRLKYEPDAYDHSEDDARIEAGWKRYMQYNRQRQDVTYQEEQATERPSAMFETMAEVLAKPKEERVCIPTGLKDFDKRVGGLAKGEISLVSGLRGAAKSTWLSQVLLNAVDQGYNTLAYSGELKDKRFYQWLSQQAAGKANVIQSKKYEGLYFCKDEIKNKIADWMGDHVHLYNNNYGSNFKAIAQSLREVISDFKADFVVIDNMSILDLSDITTDRRADKWDQQKIFVETLKNLSLICNCHICFVAHPRKAMGFLRLDDVGGSGSLGNLVDNAFIVHRNNTDFSKGYKAYRGHQWSINCDNVIEIVKERESGMQDIFIPLWYEKETRRLLNDPDEHIVYGWDDDGFIDIPEEVAKDLPWD
jgi:archaellum biogenesis ATPase FlaH